MKRILISSILTVLISITVRAQISVGYINGYYSDYPVSAIDFENLTYISMSFVYPQANGSISVDSWFLNRQLVDAAHAHGTKVIVSVGGYGGSDGFSPMAADTAARRNFVKNLVDFCTANGFDGADLDWEYPAAKDRDNLTALVSEIRQAFNNAGISSLSMAITSTDWSNVYDIANLKDNIDWFGVMTYDYYGTWESTSGNDAPLYSSSKQTGSMDYSVKYYLGRGMPKDKMCVGMPFGGYLLNSKAMYSANSGGASYSYIQATDKLKQGWEFHWDGTCKQPYLQNPGHTQLITYDDTVSIKLKCEYVRKNNLKGTIIWKIGRDYSSQTGTTPLLNMIGKYLLSYPSEIPQAPSPSSPAGGETKDSTSLTFIWAPNDLTTSYSLQVSTASDFSNFVINKSGIDLTDYAVNNLNYGTKYYWRVSAANLNGESGWSAVQSFTTKENITGVGGLKSEVPENFSLENYPNPFNPATVITYQLPASGKINLKVYDILGNEVVTLVDGEQSAGNYMIVFGTQQNTDGRQLSSGIYICVLRAGGSVLTRKLELMK